MPFVAVLILIALISLCAVFIIISIKRFVRRISGGLRASDIKYAIDMARQYEEDPPEKSVSGATDLYLRKITSDFPDFHLPEAKASVTALVNEYLLIRYAGQNDFIRSQTEKYLADSVTRNSENKKVSDVEVHKIAISGYIKTPEYATITYQVAVGSRLDDKNTEERYKIQSTFKFEDAGAPSQTFTCRNCGATLKASSMKFCEYCGCGIAWDTRRAWKFSAIEPC